MLRLTSIVVALTALPGFAAQDPRSSTPQSAPTREARDWVVDEPDDPSMPPSRRPTLRMEGPFMRIISPEPTVAITQRFVLTGNFELRAAFLPGAANTAEFGFAFGRGDRVKTHLAVVLRPDGSVTIESHAATRDPLRRWDAAHSWKGSTDPVLLEMRVANSRARLFVNGKVVGELALSARQAEGSAGIYVGAGADLRVSGFSVTATRASLR